MAGRRAAAVRIEWTDLASAGPGLVIRRQVFVVEQGVDPALERDALDAHAHHAVAWVGEMAVGAARLVAGGRSAKLGRMAVLPDRRGHGIGTALVRAALTKARALGAAEVRLHAQRHAEGWYARLGFSAVGEPFEEAGMPHIEMVCALEAEA